MKPSPAPRPSRASPPARVRHNSHRTTARTSHAHAPPSASPLERTQPHARDAHAQTCRQPSTLCTLTSTVAQHTLPRLCTSPLLRASPPPDLCPCSRDRGSAPPPPPRRPASPLCLFAFCTASLAHFTAYTCHALLLAPPMCPAAAARSIETGGFCAHRTRGIRLHCAVQPHVGRHTNYGLTVQQQMLACSAGWMHTCSAGTHVLNAHMHCSTPWADVVWLWICTQTCKSGSGMGTTLKWKPARASGQGGYAPLRPVFQLSLPSHIKGINQSPNHQYLPAASPRSAQTGGWSDDCD